MPLLWRFIIDGLTYARSRAYTHTYTHTLGFIVSFHLLRSKNNSEIPQRAGSVTWSNVNTSEDKGVQTHQRHKKIKLVLTPQNEMEKKSSSTPFVRVLLLE